MGNWSREYSDIPVDHREFEEMGGDMQMFPTREEARDLYGLPPDEDLILEMNIGGPPEKARESTSMLAGGLQELLDTREGVKIFQARDPQTKKVIVGRIAVTAGPEKTNQSLTSV